MYSYICASASVVPPPVPTTHFVLRGAPIKAPQNQTQSAILPRQGPEKLLCHKKDMIANGRMSSRSPGYGKSFKKTKQKTLYIFHLLH